MESENREKEIRLSLDRLTAYDRAMTASRLVRDNDFYLATDQAVRKKDAALFKEVCIKANIPEDLAKHMWKIVDASWETVYSKESPNPIW
jgi:hypothetical protein